MIFLLEKDFGLLTGSTTVTMQMEGWKASPPIQSDFNSMNHIAIRLSKGSEKCDGYLGLLGE